MKVKNLALDGLKLVMPRVFPDARGFFFEAYQERRYREAGIEPVFVQDNHSGSVRGTVRGLHYQSHPGQAKLVSVASGRTFEVAVDIRPGSPTFGRWEGLYLDAERHEQLFLPVGFAHGFCVVSEFADVLYKVSSPYAAETEASIRFDDPELAIEWPVREPIVSERDRTAESFASLRERLLGTRRVE